MKTRENSTTCEKYKVSKNDSRQQLTRTVRKRETQSRSMCASADSTLA